MLRCLYLVDAVIYCYDGLGADDGDREEFGREKVSGGYYGKEETHQSE